MGVLKEDEHKIEAFSFRSLIPQKQAPGEVEDFKLSSLKESQAFKNNISQADIRSEREAALETSFEILNEVKEHRGLSKQAKEDYEIAVAKAVEAEVARVRDEAYRDGMDQGLQDGKEQAYTEAKKELSEKLEAFTDELARMQGQIDNILLESQEDAYNIIKNLSKWIVLKEVDEKYYLSRLLEKLVHEVNRKNNLVLHVNESAFGYMPEIIKLVERKVGKLQNTRVEIDLDQTENGIVLETENCIIDGSIQAQFKAIDELFRSVGLDDSTKA
ncbi:MAG: hypothetical protein CME65_15245 [Halobacteriovoraceae bacterium]|nr:hypothetical protein [Halobacteriovoraceae bacterium]|tara:strand:- start:5863 stop:6681 length:819 start_codon:yes stop_codon:yes gene_type:complete